MNIKILSQNIVNNPNNFTAEQIEKYFENYAKSFNDWCDEYLYDSDELPYGESKRVNSLTTEELYKEYLKSKKL